MTDTPKDKKRFKFKKDKTKDDFGRAAKKKAPINRRYRHSIVKGGFDWAIFGPLVIFSALDGGATAITYALGGLLGANTYENYRNDKKKQKVDVRKNEAGQRLKGPIWAHDANDALQKALYYAYAENGKSRAKYREKTLSEIQKIEGFLQVVDNKGEPTGDQIQYLKTPPEVVKSKTVIPGSVIDSKGKAHKTRRSDSFGV